MNPPEWVLFMGRFHVVLLHLPIGLLVVLAFLELLARNPRHKAAGGATGYILALAVPAVVFTALCGWWLSLAGGYDVRLLQWHFWTGIGSAVALSLAAVLHFLGLKKLYRGVLLATLALVLAAGHLGGSLTHGSDYLVRYAPGPLRRLGGADEPEPATATGDRAAQPAYAAVVHPILDKYCVSCHGPEKVKGGLRLDSLEGVRKGGENGPLIVAGKARQSELVKRIRLPLESDDHMPPDGKPQPTADDVALLAWWIDAGAPGDTVLSQVPRPEPIQKILAGRLGAIAPVATEPVAQSSARPLAEIKPVADKLAGELGVSILPLAQTEPWLQCSAAIAGPAFGDEQLAKLQPLASNLRWLDLSGTSITDTGAVHFAAMTNLTRLYLQRTAITDTGLARLEGLRELAYLNLYGTGVSDEGLQHLEDLPQLRQLYLWQTRVSSNAALAFATNRVDQDQINHWEDEIAALEKKIRDNRFEMELGIPLTVTQAPTAINTHCPVSGKPVDPARTVTHEGKRVAFCCEDCKAKFEKDPTPYLSKLAPEASAGR